MKNGNKTYNVKTIDSSQNDWRKNAIEAKVDNFPWASDDDYRPETSAWLATDGVSLFIYMETNETDLRALTTGLGYVHTDSCMEFFVCPDPASSQKYLNFELNPIGAMHLAIGTCRKDRVTLPIENYKELFNVKTGTNAKGWNLEFRIPLSFLREFFPSMKLKSGHVMRGNFYKCGDNTPKPHYGCWSPIDLPKPDFHNSDFFSELVLE